MPGTQVPAAAAGSRTFDAPVAPAPLAAVPAVSPVAGDAVEAPRRAPAVAPNPSLTSGLRAPTSIVPTTGAAGDLRAQMHAFVKRTPLEALGMDRDWAEAFIDDPEHDEDELCDELARWKGAAAAHDAEAAAANGRCPVTPHGPTAQNIISRDKIISPGRMSSRESNQLRADLRKLHFATGPGGASGPWDADAFEGYKDFVERALLAGKLTPEVAFSAKPKDIAVVKALLHATAKTATPDAAMMATPAQATIDTTVGPEWTTRVIVTRHHRQTTRTTRRVSTGHVNKPADVAKVQNALIARGFYVDPKSLGTYDTTTQQAIQLFNAAYNGLAERDGGSASFASGTKTTRSLFGNAKETPQLIDGPRWSELRADPAIGLEIYATPGSYTTSWGTQRARQFVIDFATALHTQIPGYELRANDISKREGGPHPFHHGHQVGLEADLTHPDEPEKDNTQWVADRKAELKVMAQFKERIAFIYSSQQSFIDYGRKLGLPIRHASGHEGHFHVALKGWTG